MTLNVALSEIVVIVRLVHVTTSSSGKSTVTAVGDTLRRTEYKCLEIWHSMEEAPWHQLTQQQRNWALRTTRFNRMQCAGCMKQHCIHPEHNETFFIKKLESGYLLFDSTHAGYRDTQPTTNKADPRCARLPPR